MYLINNMKILILSSSGDEIRKKKYKNVNNISAVYGYMYYKNMKRYIKDNNLDIEVIINKMSFASTINRIYDHCFILYNRGTQVLDKESFDRLRKHIKNKIFTISPSSKIIGDEDILIHYTGKEKEKSIKINWTADEMELIPKQNTVNKIRILIDHKYYGKKDSRIFNNDQTEYIAQSLLDYQKLNKNIEIIQISTDDEKGYKIVNKIDDVSDYDRREATSFKNIYPIYETSSIFVVTHEECMGLSTLECNMAGCKVVIPKDYIKTCFSNNLDFVDFNPNYDKEKKIEINWGTIIKNINPEKTRNTVKHLTFYNAINKIFKRFIL